MTDVSSIGERIKGPRKTILGATDSLEGIITFTLADGALCYVTEASGTFQLHRDSALAPDRPEAVSITL